MRIFKKKLNAPTTICIANVQDIDPEKPNYVGQGKTIGDYPGRININMPGRPLRRDWLHCNSMDYNAELGHIAIPAIIQP